MDDKKNEALSSKTEHFTCISYDTTDFLIPSRYVVSGIYLYVDKSANYITFNKETLPHIFIGDYLEQIFNCKPKGEANAVVVLNLKDFAKDVAKSMVSLTDTAFPATGNLALSVTGNINSHIIQISELRLPPKGIRSRLLNCGICAIHFNEDGRKQLLISPDSLLRRHFAGGKQ